MARILVAGGAGFVGSHLCDALVARGDEVVCVDDLCTGATANLAGLSDRAAFTLVEGDITQPLPDVGPVDGIFNLACPASPPDYFAMPLATLRVSSIGTDHLLELARRSGARLVHASTSEVYGDPLVHPQPESYWGNVNPIGPRSMYDEGKRYAEALVMAQHRTNGVDVGIVRIFNTYGPRMRPDDGRVVSNFVVQALRGEPLTVHGDGSQTRSFCYVDDEVAGLLALYDSDLVGPVNIGNPDEFTMLELAELVLEATGSDSPIEHLPAREDDPKVRRPDITVAREELGWEPLVPLAEGVARTVAWFRQVVGAPGPRP